MFTHLDDSKINALTKEFKIIMECAGLSLDQLSFEKQRELLEQVIDILIV